MSQLVFIRKIIGNNLWRQLHQINQIKQIKLIKTISSCSICWQKTNQSSNSKELEAGKYGACERSTDVRPLAEKVKENAKTASYTVFILAGFGVTAVIVWATLRELFSSSSPNNIYAKAFKKVIEDTRVQDALGMPIKAYGEKSPGRRRQYVAHAAYERNGVPHTRMLFHIQGIRNKGQVHLEVKQTSTGEMLYRYLFVQLDHYPYRVIILEDNRKLDPSPAIGEPSQLQLNGPEISYAAYDGRK